MNRQILDSLIQDESIRSLLEKSADAYWLSEIYDYNLGISNNEQEILVRLAVLYSTLSLSEESKNTKNLEYAYKLLLAIKIEDSNYLSLFEKIAGIDEVDNTLLYYFLLSSIALKDDNTISARINLKQFYSDNIIITEDGIAKVTDFGIAKAVSNSTITAFGTTIGSVHYFSPEQAKGGYTDAKSDIYSLGVVMYEMLTGKVPFA